MFRLIGAVSEGWLPFIRSRWIRDFSTPVTFRGDFIKQTEMETIKRLGLEHRLQLISRRDPERLRAGDIVSVRRKFMESSKRILQFTGICIAIKRRGLGSSIIVRTIIEPCFHHS
jgi:hypothetical protein